MRPKREPVPRAKEAWVWLGGILVLGLLGAGVTVAAVLLWENIDIRQLTPGLAEASPPLPQPTPPAPAAWAAVPFTAVVLRTPANASYFEDSTYYDAELDRWQALIEGIGGTVRVATDGSTLRETGIDELMVLPEAPCLSSEELAAIGAHMSVGGSVVVNWALGVRDGACEWRGWGPLLEVTGAADLRELPAREALYLTVPGGLPTSTGIDPGTRIELRPDPSLSLRVSGERVYWSDWALNPAPDDEGAGADVAVTTTRSPEGGRVTWFGVRTRQGATPADSIKLDRMLENGIRWAAGIPSAAPAPWPGAAQAALVFALDVEGQDVYINALDAAAMFELEELPISFYPVSQLVEEDDSLAQVLVAAGEVGTQTVDHTPLAGLTTQDQSIRLRRSWNDIESWAGIGPTGLRPPEEAFDSTTLRAWRAAGGRYVLAANEARSASPEVHDTSEGPIVLLPRLLKDDYTVIVRDVTIRSERLADAFLAGTQKMRAIGGLGVIGGHTQIIEAGPRLEAIRTVADSVRADGGWWMAQADEVAEWWLNRSHIELRWTEAESLPTGSAMQPAGVGDLVASVPSGWSLDDLWIDVVAPDLMDGAIPLVDGLSVDFVDEDWGLRVRLGALGEGEVRRISFVTLDREAPPT